MNNVRIGDWIQTYSGRAMYPLDPRSDEICIHDIAHALSNQCRFSGHTSRFYSVAEHSVHVSILCNREDAMWGLLHDASEAYLSDVAKPVKMLPEMDVYRQAERGLQAYIAGTFGLSLVEPESVRAADKLMLAIEARDLMDVQNSRWRENWRKWIDLIPEGCDKNVSFPLSPTLAKEIFLNRFYELGGKL